MWLGSTVWKYQKLFLAMEEAIVIDLKGSYKILIP